MIDAEIAECPEVGSAQAKLDPEAQPVDEPRDDIIADEEDEEVWRQQNEDAWDSRWSFILAAIGSAIGLGNFWRFPFLAFKWGGATFFIPYIIGLVVVGIPLMQLEMGIGQVFQVAATQSFGKLHPRFRGVGLGAAAIAFGICGYYFAVLGWGNVMLIRSFPKDMPWSIRGANGTDVIDIPSNFFYNDLLLLGDPSEATLIAFHVFLGALFMWGVVYFILYRGTKFISKAVWVTVLLPVVTLLILMIVGATLDGARIGVEAYIWKWDTDLLSEGQMWVDAFTQIFFSLSLATAVQVAYASMNPRTQNIVQDAYIVSICNCTFSFFAGFAVFTVAGYFSAQTGVPIDELSLGGPSLAFITYPAGLSLIEGWAANFLTILFFVTFFMLGVDSAFSLIESVILNFREIRFFEQWTRKEMVALMCFAGAVSCTMYLLDIGLFLLDVADRFISTFGLTVIGFLECFVAGWMYNIDAAMDKVGKAPVLIYNVGMWGGFALFTCLSLGLPYNGNLSKAEVYGVAFGVGLGVMIPSALVALVLAAKRAGSFKSGAYYVMVFGVDSLKDELNATVCAGKGVENWRFTLYWALLLRYAMGPIIFFLMAINVEELSANPYGDYSGAYQAFGTVLLCIVILFVAVGMVEPTLYEAPIKSRYHAK